MRRMPYRAVSHPLQLDEAAWLEAAGDGEQVGAGHDVVSQRRVELDHGGHLVGVLLLDALEQALELLLASALRSAINAVVGVSTARILSL